MKKALALTLILALLFSAVAGTRFVNMGKGNPYIQGGIVPPEPGTNPPTITISSPENNKTYAANSIFLIVNASCGFSKTAAWPPNMIKVYFKSDWQENSTTIWEHSDLGSFTPYVVVSFNLTEIPEGNHSISVYATERGFYLAGATVNAFYIDGSSTVSFAIDTLLPSISVLSPQNKTYKPNDVSLKFTVDHPVTHISYSLDGQANVTTTGNMTLSRLSKGAHNVTVYAQTSSGNIGASETITFTIAETEPFPTTLVATAIVSVAVVGIGLLVYFKKRKN